MSDKKTTKTTYFLALDISCTRFATKKQAIFIGKLAHKANRDVRLIEQIDVWAQSGSRPIRVSSTTNDRTILICDCADRIASHINKDEVLDHLEVVNETKN